MTDLIGQQLGAYRVLEELGRGGMATIYRGISVDQQMVAIKVLPAYLAHNLEYLKRFKVETKAVVKLEHPHIVRVLETGSVGRIPYIVMEYVPGGTLKDFLEQRDGLALEHAVQLCQQLAGALAYAHERQIIHRDVKPANVLMASPDEVKLSDFGIAKVLTDTSITTMLTAGGASMGTREYMAPEQMTDASKVDQRADIYSLGVVFYEMVSGVRPYAGDTPLTILQKPTPAVRRDAPDVPEVFEHILLKAMAIYPEERFETMADFAGALHAAINAEPVSIVLPQKRALSGEDTALEQASITTATEYRTEQDFAGDEAGDAAAGTDLEWLAAIPAAFRVMFRKALDAYDKGDMDTALWYVRLILKKDERVSQAWLLRSFIEENWYDQMRCAENALFVAPDSLDASMRLEQLKSARLPATVGRTHSVIPAVQDAHDDAMARYFQESKVEAQDDPLDDPLQCPYCGVINELKRRKCVHCGKSMMRRIPPVKDPVPLLRMAQMLSFGVLLMVLLQMFAPLLWSWYDGIADGTRLKWTMDTIFEQRPAVLVAGSFTEVLTPDLFEFLLTASVVRTVLLVLVIMGLRFRFGLAFYLGAVMGAVELLWAVMAFITGWTGVFIMLMSALLAVGFLMSLVASSPNFLPSWERYLVKPDLNLRSGLAYWQLGNEYRRNGLWAMAIAQYRKAIANAPNNAPYYKSLGIGYNKIGRVDRAMPALEQALILDPTDLEVRTLIKHLEADAPGERNTGTVRAAASQETDRKQATFNE